MIYKDRIYGKIKIENPLVLELIKSPSLQRLKDIDQVGFLPVFEKILSQKIKKLTRFEHSLGVFILLRKFKASFEEQIAGLLHDVSHSVFSHAIDYVVDEGSEKDQSFQDKILKSFIKNSEIPSIFKKYNLNLDYILEKENFPLLEKDLPDLCADRIDYSLRSAVCNGVILKKEVKYFLKNLSVYNNLWVFKNFQSAKKYAKLFYFLNKVYYSGFATAVMFKTISDVMKYCLKEGYLKRKDLFATDKEVLNKIKLKVKKDKKLKLLFERMKGKVKVKNDPKNYDAIIFCKSRIVDPYFKVKNEIKKLSEVDKNWARIVRKELQPKKYFLKFEPL